ncbi:MAG TPA: MBL fold metallo-hydrolase [Ramlibacter sp.]|jgi:glyoxylase-like metal-dependent hydrolase (beta-lactamase superfamily II)|uniref:MBL fold metallo-hydrolase n=1 Tax=Ramlibacter sp. TaxID=1917967 RepID=UPI002D6B1B13|nr:MBL fold metallo-hydrolase [Ramlibacter sp.]HZY20638.1 MBL fold metallo-hydrolase [Ramlibacter sp.]
MNPQERQLDYPFGDTLPAAGATLEVAPDVRWVRMALPFALDHINLWLLRDAIDGREGWSVVDCCVARDEAKVQWEQVFASSLQGLPVLRVIVTHMHPDHIGLAHWLCERWSTPREVGSGPAPAAASGWREGDPWTCRLWISATDYNAARIGSQSTTGFGGDSAADFFASHGLSDPEAIAKIRARSSYYPSMVPAVPASFRRLQDGETVAIGGRAWECISGFGHAPEHIALFCPELKVLVSGDMVLPRISTNISVHDVEPESNPLRAFLASIDKFRRLPPDTLVLPSHGKPFTGLHRRIEQLHAHHRERLADVLLACAQEPRTAAEMLPVLFRRTLDLHQTTFAMGEAVAHLHALWFDGQLRRRQGDDGVWRFVAA